MAIKTILLPICDDGDFKHLAQAAFQIGRMLSAQVRGLFMLTPYFPLTSGAALTAPISGPLTLPPHLLQTSGDEFSSPVSAPLPLRPYFLPTSSEAFPPESSHYTLKAALLGLLANSPQHPAPQTSTAGILCRRNGERNSDVGDVDTRPLKSEAALACLVDG